MVERVACLDCAYTQADWNITGGPSWWGVKSSALDELEMCLDKSLTRQPPTISDILNTLPSHIIKHEFLAHLKDFDWFTSDIEQEIAA